MILSSLPGLTSLGKHKLSNHVAFSIKKKRIFPKVVTRVNRATKSDGLVLGFPNHLSGAVESKHTVIFRTGAGRVRLVAVCALTCFLRSLFAISFGATASNIKPEIVEERVCPAGL